MHCERYTIFLVPSPVMFLTLLTFLGLPSACPWIGWQLADVYLKSKIIWVETLLRKFLRCRMVAFLIIEPNSRICRSEFSDVKIDNFKGTSQAP